MVLDTLEVQWRENKVILYYKKKNNLLKILCSGWFYIEK